MYTLLYQCIPVHYRVKSEDCVENWLDGSCYLQKTLPGGIMLIELGFKEVHFCVKVYVLECSCLPMGQNVNNFVSTMQKIGTMHKNSVFSR